MRCATVQIGGVTAIVCGRERSKKCSACGQVQATRLCDWKTPGAKKPTCDKPLCINCSFSPAEKKDLCPEHHESFKRWLCERTTRNKK